MNKSTNTDDGDINKSKIFECVSAEEIDFCLEYTGHSYYHLTKVLMKEYNEKWFSVFADMAKAFFEMKYGREEDWNSWKTFHGGY